MKTFTTTAAWAAALAVMSISGPFTTAEAAPARLAHEERPRPVYGKLHKRLGFNDSTETTTTTSHRRVHENSLLSVLASDTTSSSDRHPFRVSPTHHNAPLTSSSSHSDPSHSDPHRKESGSAHSTGSKNDPLDPLLSSLLGSSGSSSSSGGIIAGVTTILHHTPDTSTPGTSVTGTGHKFNSNFRQPPPPTTTTNGLPPIITGTGGLTGALSTVLPKVLPTVTTGLTGPGTGLTRTEHTITDEPTITSPTASAPTPTDDPTANSTTTSLIDGTLRPHVLTGTVLTITRDGTSVIISVPTSTPLTPGLSPTVTTTLSGATITQSPVATTSNDTETATHTRTRTTPSDTVTSNDTTILPSTTSSTIAATSSAQKTATFQPQVTISPTATNTQTTLSLPSTWSFAPTSTGRPSRTANAVTSASSSTASSAAGIPARMPKLVQPAAGMPTPPVNSTLIQVGFDFGLNYPYVVSKPEQAALIFGYLPQGIAYGLGISKDSVQMNALVPYDTDASLGYVTTLAQTYIPSDLVGTLQLNIHAPASQIYTNPNAPVSELMGKINPTIPILPGASLDSNPASASANPASTTRVVQNQGVPIGGDSGTSHKVNGSTVGIGAGAVAGAAVYAAAMIYVARRYRQKMKSHRRVSSVTSPDEMTQRSSGGMGSLFMSGANGRTSPRASPLQSGARGSRTSNGSSNGRSVREQGISAPLSSENSLGWN